LAKHLGSHVVALIDHDEIEEIGRVLAEPGGGSAVWPLAAHEGLEDGEEHTGVGGHAPLLAQGIGFEAGEGVVFEGGETGEVVEGLIGEVVAIGEEQDARPAGGLAGEVPAGLEQLPDDLEGDGCFAGAGGQGVRRRLGRRVRATT
jgi:hypothetical protein